MKSIFFILSILLTFCLGLQADIKVASMQVKDSVAIITFDNAANGLTTFGKIVEGFEIAGQDSVFYPAKLTISNKQARIYSPHVKVPLAVRYNFRNFIPSNGFLYNTAGLPVIPFRTDNWNK